MSLSRVSGAFASMGGAWHGMGKAAPVAAVQHPP